jgi:hypothetical protein
MHHDGYIELKDRCACPAALQHSRWCKREGVDAGQRTSLFPAARISRPSRSRPFSFLTQLFSMPPSSPRSVPRACWSIPTVCVCGCGCVCGWVQEGGGSIPSVCGAKIEISGLTQPAYDCSRMINGVRRQPPSSHSNRRRNMAGRCRLQMSFSNTAGRIWRLSSAHATLYSRTCRKHLPVKFRNSSCAKQLPNFD